MDAIYGYADGMDITRIATARAYVANGTGRLVRESARLSLAELAAQVGVHRSAVWRWEHGDRMPRGEAAEAYADVIERLLGRRS